MHVRYQTLAMSFIVFVATSSASAESESGNALLLHDEFITPRAVGAVHDTPAEPGPGKRIVTDDNSNISVKHSRLFIPPVGTPGWGQSTVAYGPFDRENGLTFLWQFRLGDMQGFDSNTARFAVGVYPDANPANALKDGMAMVIRDNVEQAGSLGIARSGFLQTLHRLKDVPLWVLGTVRDDGIVLYAGSLAGVHGLPAWPTVRPIGVLEWETFDPVYPLFTRYGTLRNDVAYAVQGKVLELASSWWNLAIAAQDFRDVKLADGSIEHGDGAWIITDGEFTHDADGVGPVESGWNRAFFNLHEPAGLVKITFTTGASPLAIALWTRVAFDGATPDHNDSWQYYNRAGFQNNVTKYVDGRGTNFGVTGTDNLAPNTEYTVQFIDDGERIRLFINDSERGSNLGHLDTQHGSNTGIGFGFQDASTIRVQRIEAHPRTLALPATLRGLEPLQLEGTNVVYRDDFAGAAATLAGRIVGGSAWEQTLVGHMLGTNGSGSVVVTGGSGLGLYTLPWSGGLAELRSTITTDGNASTQNYPTIAFYQDAENFLLVSLYRSDAQPTNGEVEVELAYGGAVSNLDRVAMGSEIRFGGTHELRATFDGDEIIVHVDGEPVVSYSVRQSDPARTLLTINRVGIAVRSADSGGSTFDSFKAMSIIDDSTTAPTAAGDRGGLSATPNGVTAPSEFTAFAATTMSALTASAAAASFGLIDGAPSRALAALTAKTQGDEHESTFTLEATVAPEPLSAAASGEVAPPGIDGICMLGIEQCFPPE